MTGEPGDGLLLVDKPEGPTSHDVVARARRVLGVRRIGHTGTLDPLATGLLLLVVGRATRLARFLPHSPKRYEGAFRLGLTTTSDDRTGEIVGTHDGPLPDERRVRDAAEHLTGIFEQSPPRISARKVGGERLYRLARRGREVEAQPRSVRVDRFEIEPTGERGVWTFVAEVSAGTYVRSLARDLGSSLGCGGILESLRRTGIGPLSVTDATPLSALGESPRSPGERAWIPLDTMPLELSSLTLPSGGAVRLFRSGAAVTLAGVPGVEGPVRVLSPSGALLGVAEHAGEWLLPRVVIPDPD